jgi:hypothetical protein
MNRLPTFEDTRRDAYRLLGDTQDVLRSDWAEGTGPNPKQSDALQRALRAITEAKNALNEAAN